MKNRYGLALLLTGILVFWSCKSTGTVTEVTPSAPSPTTPEAQPQPPAGPDQAAVNALNTAIARAEKERKLAEDFKSPSYFPAEWGTAEGEYRSITVDRTSTATVQAAERRYNAVADTYHALFQKTVPLYAADIEDEGLKARDAAIAAGIVEYVPEYLDIADDTALSAESAYFAEDYYKAQADALEALDRYRSLTTGLEAYHIREQIEQRNATGFDQTNFDRADQILLAAAASYEGEAVKDALAGAGESKTIYDTILKAATR